MKNAAIPIWDAAIPIWDSQVDSQWESHGILGTTSLHQPCVVLYCDMEQEQDTETMDSFKKMVENTYFLR